MKSLTLIFFLLTSIAYQANALTIDDLECSTALFDAKGNIVEGPFPLEADNNILLATWLPPKSGEPMPVQVQAQVEIDDEVTLVVSENRPSPQDNVVLSSSSGRLAGDNGLFTQVLGSQSNNYFQVQCYIR